MSGEARITAGVYIESHTRVMSALEGHANGERQDYSEVTKVILEEGGLNEGLTQDSLNNDTLLRLNGRDELGAVVLEGCDERR